MNHEIHETHEMNKKEEKILFKEESYQIQGAIFEVYREMGSGFLEAVYQECLEKEFTSRKLPFVAQQELKLLCNYSARLTGPAGFSEKS